MPVDTADSPRYSPINHFGFTSLTWADETVQQAGYGLKILIFEIMQ